MPKILFWIAAVAAVVILAYGIAVSPEGALFWSAVAFLTYLFVTRERLALYLFIFLPVLGELYRIPWGPENGLLLSDLFIPFFIGIWVVKRYFSGKSLPDYRLLKPFLVFCLIACVSLLQAFLFLKPSEVFMSSFYLVRLASYTLLYLVAADSIKEEKQARRLFIAMAVSALAVSVAGFIQLAVYPDLGNLEQYGWDPHRNRLVSTWLDPNFVGGLLSMMTCMLLGLSFYMKRWSSRFYALGSAAVLAFAIFLTYSRSAYLALAAGIVVIGLLKSRRLLVACLLIFAVGIVVLPRAEQRLSDLSRSVSSFIFNTSDTPDPTASLRIKSWEQTLELIAKRPLLGSGYNTLRYVNYNEGFVTDPAIHSASGSDSSLLTVFATTGIAGIIPFLWFYLAILKTAWTNYRHDRQSPFAKGYSLGLLAALISLLVHSLFVNSLLFPQILIFSAALLGILIWIESRRVPGR